MRVGVPGRLKTVFGEAELTKQKSNLSGDGSDFETFPGDCDTDSGLLTPSVGYLRRPPEDRNSE